MKSYHIINKIGHFRVPKTLTFKMRPIAQPFLWKWVLFAWERKHFHIKGWALNLVLMQRPRRTRKWPILEFTLKAALQGCLPFKQTIQVEILCINITLENLRWCENDPLQSKSAKQTKKSRNTASPQKTAHIFWSFPNGMAGTIWFSNRNFRVFHVNS